MRGAGITKGSVEALGERYPLKVGWYDRLLGKDVTEEAYAAAVESRDAKDKELDAASHLAAPLKKPSPRQHKARISDLERRVDRLENFIHGFLVGKSTD